MLNETRNERSWRCLATAGIAVTSAAAMVAWAADPVPAQNGLMTFPNVRVVSAPSLPANPGAIAAPESQGGFKAYIDPATGRFTKPSAEAAAALNAAAKAHAKQAGVKDAHKPLTFTSPHGGVGMRRDESHVNYLVARMNADGTLGMACVPAEHAAEWLSKGNNVVTNKPAVKGELK
jgi:hypothetical protein